MSAGSETNKPNFMMGSPVLAYPAMDQPEAVVLASLKGSLFATDE